MLLIVLYFLPLKKIKLGNVLLSKKGPVHQAVSIITLEDCHMTLLDVLNVLLIVLIVFLVRINAMYVPLIIIKMDQSVENVVIIVLNAKIMQMSA